MSAALDGEDPGLPQAEVTAHVRSCPTCARWHDQAVALDRRVRIRESDLVPDLVPAVAAQVRTAPDGSWWRPAWPWRVTLAVVGLLQVVQGIPAAAFGSDHLANEMGAWSVALGAGLLYAAWRPARAAGLVPFVGALVAFLVLTTFRDVLAGNAGLADEASHLLEVFGLFLLCMVARLDRTEGRAVIAGELHPA